MTDPVSSMSLTAVIVLTVVVLVGISGWLGMVFFVGREPKNGGTRPAGRDPGHVGHLEAGHPGAAPAAGPAGAPGGDGTAGQAGHSLAPSGQASGGHR